VTETKQREPIKTSMNTKCLLINTWLALLAGIACASAQTNWTQFSPSGDTPPTRAGTTAVVNPANGRMIVFDGAGSAPDTELSDIWIFQDVRTNAGSTWQPLTVSGAIPSPRGFHSAVYDQAHNQMIIFGGDPTIGYCNNDLNDVWVLTNADGTGGTASWTQLSPVGTAPAGRSTYNSAVYDQANNRMIIYGGTTQCATPNYSDLWVLTNANGLGGTPGWIQLSTAGAGPGPRAGQADAYDAANNQLILFGGYGSGGYSNDVWVLSNANGLGGTATWTQLNPTGTLPSPRNLFASAYDPALNILIVFGGFDGWGNDTWVLSNANGLGGTPAWTQLNPTGTLPAGRAWCAGAGVPGAGAFVIFAGIESGWVDVNTVWSLQYTAPSPWLNIVQAGNQAVLYWPASATNCVLQTTTNLASPNWVTVTNGVPIIGVTLTNSSSAAFFRLH
jgi:hypothetical protein